MKFSLLKTTSRDQDPIAGAFDSVFYACFSSEAIGTDSALEHFWAVGDAQLRAFSPVFHPQWYVHSNELNIQSSSEAYRHYVTFGAANELDPHPLFSTRTYRSRFPDTEIDNPVLHYLRNADGRSSTSRSPTAYFDTKYYLRMNPDVAGAEVDPLIHYLTYGWRERRNPSPYFNTNWYLSRYGDVAEAGIEPLQHYLIAGRFEGRQPHHLFDSGYYLSGALDVAEAGVEPLLHFTLYGDAEGRSAHPLFNPQFYRHSHPEIGSAPAFAHYSEAGSRLLYSPCPAFDPEYYLWHYPDALARSMEPLLDFMLAPAATRRQFHPLLDSHYQRLTSVRSAQGMEPLTDYVQFRSHFNPSDFARGATTIPKPKRALLIGRGDGPLLDPGSQPKISVVIPCYNSNQRYLKACLDSIRCQDYDNWELLIVDDGSPDPATWDFITSYARLDDRIRAIKLPKNQGISGATNEGVLAATGHYVALVDHDDVVMPNALSVMVSRMVSEGADVAYSDQAYRSAWDIVEEPHYKPDWSPVLFAGVMYVGHLLIFRRQLGLEAGLFDKSFDGCQDYEFMLRLSERTSKILHVPEILYHWRRAEGSVASDSDAKGKIEPLQAKAVNAHFQRLGLAATATPEDRVPHRLAIRPTGRAPDVGVDVVLDAGLTESDARDFASGLFKNTSARLGTLGIARGGDPSAAYGIAEGTAPYVLFVSPAVTLQTDLWFDHMMLYCQRSQVGFVAPHLFAPDGRVVAAGLAAHPRLGLVAAFEGLRYGDDGHAGSLICDREVSAVSGLFALVRRKVLDAVGGLSSAYTSLTLSVAEASYRATLAGFSNIAVAGHHVEVPNTFKFTGGGGAIDRQLFVESHRPSLKRGDRFFNNGLFSESMDRLRVPA